jgi:hypothetical protein
MKEKIAVTARKIYKGQNASYEKSYHAQKQIHVLSVYFLADSVFGH